MDRDAMWPLDCSGWGLIILKVSYCSCFCVLFSACIYTWAYVYIYIYMYICVCLCTYVYLSMCFVTTIVVKWPVQIVVSQKSCLGPLLGSLEVVHGLIPIDTVFMCNIWVLTLSMYIYIYTYVYSYSHPGVGRFLWQLVISLNKPFSIYILWDDCAWFMYTSPLYHSPDVVFVPIHVPGI